MYFVSDDIKSMGNDAYRNNNLYLALDYYEYVSNFKNFQLLVY